MTTQLTRRTVRSAAMLIALVSYDAHAATCESLPSLALPNATITLAQAVGAGELRVPLEARGGAQVAAEAAQLPAICRVAATLRPVTGSQIRIEVWLPMKNWNNKFQGVGNGGFAGTLSYSVGSGGMERGMLEAVKRGYATASTDTGHTADSGAVFFAEREKVLDFAYRAVHEMTVAAKATIAAFYGTGPRVSYWNGCSLGGRQGLIEAQRFAGDYDGIIAGAPAAIPTLLGVWNVYVGHAALNNATATIPASKYRMVHDAVMNACDASDGLKDDLIADPARCRFDFSTLQCRDDDSASCLTPAQVTTARAVTGPLTHPKTGQVIFPGLAFGTELGWNVKIGGPAPNTLGVDNLKNFVYKDGSWDWRAFDLDNALTMLERSDSVANADNPDLTAFRDRGGKLLLYHGWADPNFSAQTTIDYYNAVLGKTGDASATRWMRLFLAPGMGHCGGGAGPNAFDAVTAIEAWVENGRPPDAIIASRRVDGKVTRSRPLCPYPQVAKYQGAGSIDDSASFQCAAP